MRSRCTFGKALFAVVILCLPPTANAQQPSQPKTLLTLSEPVRSTLYPELLCVHCVIPQWDRDYLLHHDSDEDLALVSMYDRTGNKILQANFKPLHALSASVAGVGAAHSGGIRAVGGMTTNDGSVRKFIAKTDPVGHVAQLITMSGPFSPRQICESPDGGLWVLGYNADYRESPDADKNVLRHYNEQGMVASFISLDSLGQFPDSASQIKNYLRSYIHCGKDRVSVYFGTAAVYAEVDIASGKLTRWLVNVGSAGLSKTDGFAVTDDGRIFVALFSEPEPNGQRKHALYELSTMSSSPTASLTPIQGTIAAFASSQPVPDGTFMRLWGADGNELIVSRKGEDSALSWVKVLSEEE